MEERKLKKAGKLRIAGRLFSLVMFFYLLLMSAVSFIYGAISLSCMYPSLVGVPFSVVLTCAVVLLVVFFRDNKPVDRTEGSDCLATTNHATSNREML